MHIMNRQRFLSILVYLLRIFCAQSPNYMAIFLYHLSYSWKTILDVTLDKLLNQLFGKVSLRFFSLKDDLILKHEKSILLTLLQKVFYNFYIFFNLILNIYIFLYK